MNPGAEVALVVERELRKNVRSAKGIVLLILSVLGGVAVALVLAFAEKMKSEKLHSLPPEATDEIKRQIVLQLGGGDDALGEALFKAPSALFAGFEVTVWLAPMLVALLGFDAISGELQHRSVRYWTVRSRRPSYYVGKVLGLWAVVSSLTLLVHILMWSVILARGGPDVNTGDILSWGVRFWAVSLPISLVWCAIAQLIASQFRHPVQALLVTFAVFFVLWILFLMAASGKVPQLIYLWPNSYDLWLLHPHIDRVLEGLGLLVGSAAVYAAAGAALFSRRDV
jgi:ABC-type transport system involved in multi-copper enzyme maturation permease subunit